MSISLIIGNILALLSVIFAFVSVVKKKKTDLIGWQVINIAFCIFSSIALLAYAALSTNCISLIRNMLAYKKKLTLTATIILSVLCVVVGLYVNNLGFIGSLAIWASVGYTVLMYMAKNAQQMRYAVILSSVLWVIHDFYIQSYPTVMSNCCLVAWTIIQTLKYRRLDTSHKK